MRAARTMTVTSVEAFLDELRESGLLVPERWQELVHEWLPRYRDPHALARQLRGLGWLTTYQVECLFCKKGKSLMLGPYVLLDRLGEGGMAQVYKARQQGGNRIVAIKVLRAELHSDVQAVRRFQRELRAITQLSHPNIIQAHESREANGVLFLVMEFCEGIDLARLVQRGGPLPIEEACDYLRQAALGLGHAHERAIIHRDVKPSNLLLSTGGSVVKILDMGLAALRTPTGNPAETLLTEEWTMLGTPDYVAPEQVVNARAVDHRADLYSLGCTLYYLLTGTPPFQGTEREKLLMHRCMEPTAVETIRPEVPPRVAAIVRTLMAKNPEERYATAGVAARALEAVC